MADRLDQLPGEVGVLITRGDEELVERRAADAGPLGSVFKLFVLLATAEAVRSSALTWDETLVLTDADRSLPSGRLQDQPTGTEVSVREAAQEMIAISDNTATDLLIRRLGRERVEAAFASVGGEGDGPWLTTKDFFTLGWGDSALAARWRDADEAERRRLLDGITAAPLSVDAASVTGPVWNTGIDWFASPATVAAVHEALLDTDDKTVRAILSKNTGLGADLDRTLLPYLGFKGGSAPGVLAASWSGETAKGERVIVVIQLRAEDPAAVAAVQREVFGLGADALRLAAEDGGQR
ncbi:serine hydrolase [Microbacterium binotii]|uniref:serine hydrolase n=1 Tax=Microbacterium binotii TaxID=462710 RepID=UPI001F4440E8|nr:serine hydrolase [Microbacterium binotii]UIN31944.1 class A beta-lactamase-related serine hydrolase [Microbacterium binotii]